jgi:hypothetical protein
MKVKSHAGELDVIVGETSVEGGFVVVNAGVGLWEIKVYLGPEDFKFFLSVFFKPKVLFLLLKQLLWRAKETAGSHSTEERKGRKDGRS